MIIRTQRSTARYLLDWMFTALGWAVFFAFFATGVLNILKGAVRGPDAPFLRRKGWSIRSARWPPMAYS